MNLVLHGTNEWNAEHFQECVKRGMTRCNVNDVILCNYNKYIKENAGKVPLTTLMEKGTDLMVERLEWLMDVLGSTGKA